MSAALFASVLLMTQIHRSRPTVQAFVVEMPQLHLPAGECFCKKEFVPMQTIPNSCSLLAHTAKRRGEAAQEQSVRK